jgi:histidyl-tRNA synthetase
LAVQAEGIELPNTSATQVFVIGLGEAANVVAVQLTGNLRTQGLSTDISFDSRSMKAAMKGADRCGARFAVIIGEDEVGSGTVVIKDLESGEQQSVPLDLCLQTLLKALPVASQSPKE